MTGITKGCVSLLLLALAVLPIADSTFTWDKDSVGVNCEEREKALRCIHDRTTFYQCPETCTKHLQAPGVRRQGEAEEPDDFWELQTPLSATKKLSFERFEGYVTLIVVIPLLPGMAQYYYDMLEHILAVYPYAVEILVFPIRREDSVDVHLKVPKKSKILLMPEMIREGDKIEANSVLDYLESVISEEHASVFTDRVTSFIVSFNGKFIEKQASPTLEFLEKLISHYLTEMELHLKSEF